MHRGIIVVGLVGLLSAAAVVGAATLGPGNGTASSHREAPLIAEDPSADLTDLYAFRSPDKPNTVTILANVIPGEDPAAGPNWYTFSPSERYNRFIVFDARTASLLRVGADTGAAGHERHGEVVRKVFVEDDRLAAHGLLWVHRHRQRLVVHDNGVRRVARPIAIAGHDHGDRFANVADDVDRDRAMLG